MFFLPISRGLSEASRPHRGPAQLADGRPDVHRGLLELVALESTETEMVWGEMSGLLAKEGGREFPHWTTRRALC